jgi:S-adenosylmethionine-diacylglycerol 3-amino-3-carboxypropyl transferase
MRAVYRRAKLAKRRFGRMANLAGDLLDFGGGEIRKAVYQHRAFSLSGFSERLFALLFSGLVYPQIWEDPEADMDGLELSAGHRVVTIASGGCNVLSYLSRSPARIDAVDLNRCHIALNRMKLAAYRHLPTHQDLLRFFGRVDQRHNSAAFERFVAPHLDPSSLSYWRGRGITGRRRITAFDRNFYRTGLLGLFIGAGHALARLHGVDPKRFVEARSMCEQRKFFDEELAPLFDRPIISYLTRRKAALFGLGIPPAQYDELAGADEGRMMSRVLKARLEKLACHFPQQDNYFAWQAFARRYPGPGEGTLPIYLRKEHYSTIREAVGRVHIHHRNVTDLLAARPAASVDRYVLLDAQDWMTASQLNALWTEITRTADTGARVLFRTAGERSILPGRLSPSLLDQWHYDERASEEATRTDRSAIYGGVHIYVRAAPA